MSRNKRKKDVPLSLKYSMCQCIECNRMVGCDEMELGHRNISMIICSVYHITIHLEANFATYFVLFRFSKSILFLIHSQQFAVIRLENIIMGCLFSFDCRQLLVILQYTVRYFPWFLLGFYLETLFSSRRKIMKYLEIHLLTIAVQLFLLLINYLLLQRQHIIMLPLESHELCKIYK